MRTTIRLDIDLLYRVKIYAARSGRSMTSVIEDALREMLTRQEANVLRPPLELTTVSGEGLQPGVDLDDSASLLAIMKEDNAPA